MKRREEDWITSLKGMFEEEDHSVKSGIKSEGDIGKDLKLSREKEGTERRKEKSQGGERKKNRVVDGSTKKREKSYTRRRRGVFVSADERKRRCGFRKRSWRRRWLR